MICTLFSLYMMVYSFISGTDFHLNLALEIIIYKDSNQFFYNRRVCRDGSKSQRTLTKAREAAIASNNAYAYLGLEAQAHTNPWCCRKKSKLPKHFVLRIDLDGHVSSNQSRGFSLKTALKVMYTHFVPAIKMPKYH